MQRKHPPGRRTRHRQFEGWPPWAGHTTYKNLPSLLLHCRTMYKTPFHFSNHCNDSGFIACPAPPRQTRARRGPRCAMNVCLKARAPALDADTATSLSQSSPPTASSQSFQFRRPAC
jgi:hypothetical protein